ncbi:uncharacterized protein LOC124538312 [Vanessa cardui]|uniref:uncharacterized protein LOC124538312 n=1 Tax=Vanessa cardui TaxID=171605 RepID=UPI001F145C34|nr:uncharacterized protein LOC124538312 [Vanessa cardui]
MYSYKEYLRKLRELSLNEPYVILNNDITPILKHYIRLLDQIKFEDGSYHSYYGELKAILNSFTDLWIEEMDNAIKEADRCSHVMSKEELMQMMDKTILIHQEEQADFEQQYLPIETPFEKETYDDIQIKFEDFMKRLLIFKEELNGLDKQDKVEEFAKEHFPISLKKKNDIIVFTNEFIAFGLSSVIDRVSVSLQEISNHLRNNVRAMREISEVNISHLLIRLYEKNKEHLMLSRQDVRSSVELAEVQRSMAIIKDKIEDSKLIPTQRLQEEFNYWESRMHEFQQIEKTLKKVLAVEEKVLEQEKLFYSLKDTEIPTEKLKCWPKMEEKLKQKLEQIREMKLNAAKALVTFFTVRGRDRVFYSDNVGTYYVDEYGHQCYIFDYGLKSYHVNCVGDFVDTNENEKYYYDSMGRFILNENGEKLYQLAPCSSTYRIKKDLFSKASQDCGHSEKVNEECHMTIKNPLDEVILPDVEPVDIKGKLDPKVVKYLCDTFGHVLPEVLNDVAETRPKNPIHHIAHRLLSLKFKKTETELEKMKQEAKTYREKIYKDRLQKFQQKVDAWKAKQVKRRKPEESDDTEEQFAYNAHVKQQDLIRSLENYNI